MCRRDAYEIVYRDLIDNGPKLYSGVFTTEQSRKAMYGVEIVLSHIAYEAGRYDEFIEMFDSNYEASESNR